LGNGAAAGLDALQNSRWRLSIVASRTPAALKAGAVVSTCHDDGVYASFREGERDVKDVCQASLALAEYILWICRKHTVRDQCHWPGLLVLAGMTAAGLPELSTYVMDRTRATSPRSGDDDSHWGGFPAQTGSVKYCGFDFLVQDASTDFQTTGVAVGAGSIVYFIVPQAACRRSRSLLGFDDPMYMIVTLRWASKCLPRA